ncbi:MAG: thioredoxin family protein [Chloroflexota bacterium]|nr:thioredoxin family protein [Chloroflexota bacterium]MDE2884031.1 thioredoxin family protein [Chloroflexota bacterium]
MQGSRFTATTLGALLASLIVAACAAEPTPTPTPAPTPTPGIQEWESILGTTVLRTGTQRVAFLLASGTDLVRVPEATVTTTSLDGGAEGETATAQFHEWPFGTRGSYVTQMTFPQAGAWRLDIEGEGGVATLDVLVDETSIVRDVGELGVFSNTKTLQGTGGDLGSITSHYRPDPALYEISVAEALFNRKPTVVVFASPAFCTTPTCGPQVETVTELREAYPGAADYIHVEVYDNPHEIQGDLTKGVLSPVLEEWGIDQVPHYQNESWTFILGADARIAERFEGYATFTELEEALREVTAGA